MATYNYAINEKALCYHGPMIYECKVLKRHDSGEAPMASTGEVGMHYQVHYKGWKSSWDEWVPSTRLLKYNEENLATQKGLQASVARSTGASKSTKTEGKEGGRRKDGAGTRGTKRARDEADGTRKPDLKLNVPDSLKLVLVDDWEAVTKNMQLVTLPRKPNVQELLEEFKQHMMNLQKPTQHPEVIPHIISGLCTYFDRSLGSMLLYRFERPQYAKIRKQYITGPHVAAGTEVDMSTIYGAEHLLRMIVQLPNMVSTTTMDPESVGILGDYLSEFMNFLVKEKLRIFQGQYEETDANYQNISRS